MTGRVLRFDPTAHKVVDALLPWYVNGTLEGDEREYVRVHLEECTQCRQEAVWLRDLHAACRATKPVPGATDPLRNLRRQLETRSTKRSLPARLRRVWRDSNVWTRWGAAASLGWECRRLCPRPRAIRMRYRAFARRIDSHARCA